MLAIPLVFLVFAISFLFIQSYEYLAYGHGVGEERLPSVQAGDKKVFLAIFSSSSATSDTSSQPVIPTQIPLNLDGNQKSEIIGKEQDKKIRIRLLESYSGLSAKSVTYLVTAYKAEQKLFEQRQIKSDSGIVNFVFKGGNNTNEESEFTVKEKADPNFFQVIVNFIMSLFAGNTAASSDSAGKTVVVEGPQLSYGGLYSFDIDIKTIDSYSNELDSPVEYRNVAVSVPTIQLYKIEDQGYLDDSEGLGMVSFFDLIKEFEYSPESNQVRFSFPFNWSDDNIEQISVVHEELVVPKKFTPLLSRDFAVKVNGYEIPQSAITVDDFPEDRRIIHFIVTRSTLEEIKKNQTGSYGTSEIVSKETSSSSAYSTNNPSSDMGVIEFKVDAAKPNLFPISTITKNGKYRIDLRWEPQQITPGENTKFEFIFYDTFLKNKIVSKNYELRLHDKNGKEYFVTQGESTKQKMDTIVEIPIPSEEEESPKDGVYLLTFENIGGNNHARATFHISTQ